MKVWIERHTRSRRSDVMFYAASDKGRVEYPLAGAKAEDLSQDIQDALDISYEATGDCGVLCELKLVQEEV